MARDWFQSPDEDSFAPKSDSHGAIASRSLTFQSPDEDSFAPKRYGQLIGAMASCEFQSPDEDSFAPKAVADGVVAAVLIDVSVP